MKQRPLMYLASPYSHPSACVRENRYHDVVEAAAKVMRAGDYVVFAPIAHTHRMGEYLPDVDHAFWMAQDLPWLDRCDVLGVLMIDGWADSKGVTEEIEWAKRTGKPIVNVTVSGVIGTPWPGQKNNPALYTHPSAGLFDAQGNAIPAIDANIKASNPKDLIGSDKLPLHLWPTTATAHGALALLDGALKYGRSNFRAVGVRASVYYDAANRHLNAWFEGEACDPDSGLSHLAHALACIAIVIEAEVRGNLTDDRMHPTAYRAMVESLTPHVARLKAKHADKQPKHYTIEDGKNA